MALYLSEDVENKVEELLEVLWQLWNNYYQEINYPEYPVKKAKNNGDFYTNGELISKIDSLRRNLKITMIKELMPERDVEID